MVYLAPVLPLMSEKARIFLNLDSLDFASRHDVLVGHTINAFTPLMQRIDKDKVAAMVAASKEDLVKQPQIAHAKAEPSANSKKASKSAEQSSEPPALIGIDDFAKVTMTVAKVLACIPFVDFAHGARSMDSTGVEVELAIKRMRVGGVREHARSVF